jgi:ADP-ribose pyrophosphatase YjhB (NUDIX family)
MCGKFARYGPLPRYETSDAGFCVSSFAILRRGERVLAGKPAPHPRWGEEWAPNWTAYGPGDVEEEYDMWRLPGTYLYEGEHPDDALKRVVEDQLGLKAYDVTDRRFLNFHDPSDWYPGRKHWDFCFVYEVETSASIERPPWWAELDYVDLRGTKPEAFGSAIGDLAKALGLLGE